MLAGGASSWKRRVVFSRRRMTKNRVVLPSMSSMPVARCVRLLILAAMEDEIAAEVPEGPSAATISAAREVEATSWRSTLLR